MSKYPGPYFAALTDWYTVYHLYKGDRHLDFYDLHQKYGRISLAWAHTQVRITLPLNLCTGKIVRYGPNRISINSNTALRDIYSVNANVRKSQAYATFKHFFGEVDMSMTTIDKKKHAFKRRVNVQALTPTAIKASEEMILENIRYFCDVCIGAGTIEWTTPKDMTELLCYLVSDIMGDITFSRNWNVQRDPQNRDIVKGLPDGVAGIHLVGTYAS